MIELVFIACLASSENDCQQQSLLYTDMSPTACMMAAQPELAKWVEAHPKFRIAKWRCETVNFAERDA